MNNETNLSLNKFLNKFTSEDSDSFQKLQDKAIKKHLERLEFLNSDSQLNNEIVQQSLELPSIETQQMIMNSSQSTKESQSVANRLVTWKHSNTNTVMFDPEGVKLTKDEIEHFKSRQIIVHENTRFKTNPFQTNVNSQPVNNTNPLHSGKIGVDGKEVNGNKTPSVNGFSFVPSTPCLRPESLANSPLMTWGAIEATPINLKGDTTPLLHSGGGSHFKIPEISEKESIGKELANRILLKKKAAAQENRMNSPFVKGTSNLERLNSMSPAARLLATKKLGVHKNVDNRLQASYSPLMTAATTPTPRRLVTPSPLTLSSSVTPKSDSITKANSNNDSDQKMNKRPKASHFF